MLPIPPFSSETRKLHWINLVKASQYKGNTPGPYCPEVILRLMVFPWDETQRDDRS